MTSNNNDDPTAPSDPSAGLGDLQEEILVARMHTLGDEIRRGVSFLAWHPDVPDFFKNHPIVQQLIGERPDTEKEE